MKLVVATNRVDWLAILTHEFSHFTQWIDQCKEWRTSGTSLNNIDDWLGGKEVANIKRSLNKCSDLELDNEKRSVAIIKAWNLPIDTKLYTQKANAYVAFYSYMYFTRRWCTPKISPYSTPTIYKHFPTTFNMNHKKLSKKYIDVFAAAGL
jgi:hypothetical protein